MSSAYCEIDVSLHFVLITYILNKIGLTMLTWGTLASGVGLLETSWLFLTHIFLLFQKLLVHFMIDHGVLIGFACIGFLSCHTESKSCSTSKKAVAVTPVNLKFVFVHLSDM